MTHRRIVVVGPGAIGGVIAAQLVLAGRHVEVVARGAHLDAIRTHGLTRVAPDGTEVVEVTAHATVSEADVGPDDVVVLSTKTQQAEVVLDELLVAGGPDVPIACASNGVEAERLALRRFDRVVGVLVNVPAVHLEPGVVELYATSPRGVLDVGAYPSGLSDEAHLLAEAFTAADFVSEATSSVMARKWAKLLGNTANVCSLLFGPDSEAWESVDRRLRAEADRALAAAGIEPDLAIQQHRAGLVGRSGIEGRRRVGGSTWQSGVRGTGNVESLALNGEIALLGRLHGVPTPANSLAQVEALRMVVQRRPVGSLDPAAFLSRTEGR